MTCIDSGGSYKVPATNKKLVAATDINADVEVNKSVKGGFVFLA